MVWGCIRRHEQSAYMWRYYDAEAHFIMRHMPTNDKFSPGTPCLFWQHNASVMIPRERMPVASTLKQRTFALRTGGVYLEAWPGRLQRSRSCGGKGWKLAPNLQGWQQLEQSIDIGIRRKAGGNTAGGEAAGIQEVGRTSREIGRRLDTYEQARTHTTVWHRQVCVPNLKRLKPRRSKWDY